MVAGNDNDRGVAVAGPRIVVIGAGVAGLTAARRLSRQGATVTVLEKNSRVGGRVFTDEFGGSTTEVGAQFLANFYPRTMELLDELGLKSDLVEISRKAGILRSVRIIDLTSPRTLLGSQLLTVGAKLDVASIVLSVLLRWNSLQVDAMWRAAPFDNQSVAEWAQGHRGRQELVDHLLEPALDNFLYWNPEHTSMAMLLLLGKGASAFRKLYTLNRGLRSFPAALAAETDVRSSVEVQAVAVKPGGGVELHCSTATGPEVIEADGALCATTASAVPGMFEFLDEEQRCFFARVRYSSTVQASFVTDRRVRLPYFGVMIPRRDCPDLSAVVFLSQRGWPVVPPGRDVVTVVASGAADPRLQQSDDETVARSLALSALKVSAELSILQDSDQVQVHRWPEALPVFDVGHIKNLALFADGAIERDLPVSFAGDYIGGPLIEGAVNSGLNAAARLMRRM